MNINRFIHEHKADFSEYSDKSFPLYQDLWISVASAFGIHTLKLVLNCLLKPVVDAIRRPKKEETETMRQRQNKVAIDHIM